MPQVLGDRGVIGLFDVGENRQRAVRLIGIGAHDPVDAARFVQDDLFGGASPGEDRIGDALDAVRDRFGDDAIVRRRGFGKTLMRQGPSKLD